MGARGAKWVAVRPNVIVTRRTSRTSSLGTAVVSQTLRSVSTIWDARRPPSMISLSHVGSYQGPQGRLHGGQESWQDSARRSHRAAREWSWQAQEVDRPSARYWHPINAFRPSSVVWLCTLRRHSLKCVLYVYS